MTSLRLTSFHFHGFRRHAICGAMAVLMASSAWADPALTSYLPASDAVKQTLLATPEISQAKSNKQALESHAAVIEAGEAEFTFQVTRQNRIIHTAGANYRETSIALERPIRAWGKAGLDKKIAEQTQQYANVEYMDAMHEASRELVKQWFVLLKTQTQLSNARQTLSIAEQHHRLAQKRFKQGEISQLDAQLAQAELQHAQANFQTTQAEAMSAQISFSKHYPDLAQPSSKLITELQQQALPSSIEDTSAKLSEFVSDNHELLMLRTEAQRLTIAAQRLDRDRYPDPTVGVFTSSEFGADEKITGVNLSIPIPGSARNHAAQAAHSQALAAQDMVLNNERRLSAYFESLMTQYNAKRVAAEQLREASKTQNDAARKSQTAYTLGEMSMSETLQVIRFAHEQQLGADLMHLEVLELLAMIELDLHQIYDFDE